MIEVIIAFIGGVIFGGAIGAGIAINRIEKRTIYISKGEEEFIKEMEKW